MQGPDLFNSAYRVPPSRLLGLFGILVLSTIGFLKAAFPSRPARPAGTEPFAPSWHMVNVLLLPFLACYLLLLFPLAVIAIFDRYLLEVVAVLMIYALRLHQQRISQRIPAIATATLAVVAIVAVAGTHDLFAMARAEVRLTKAVQQAGIPRTEIRGGFDFDTVTQVYAAGYLNNPSLVNPPGSFQAVSTEKTGPCADPFLEYLPALHIKYVVASGPQACTSPTSLPAETYRTWLPPARRQLNVLNRTPPSSASSATP
jgi:hypothetical protein